MDKARELLERKAFRDWAWQGEPGREAIGNEPPPEAAWRAWKARAALTPPEAVRDAVEALGWMIALHDDPCPYDRNTTLAEARKRLASLRSCVPTPAPDAVAGKTPGSVVRDEKDPMRRVLLQALRDAETTGVGYVRANADGTFDLVDGSWVVIRAPSPPLPLESDNAGEVGK